MLKQICAAAALALALNTSAVASIPKNEVNQTEVELVAQMTYCEARGEGELGMRAVAHVIMNRVEAGRWGHSPTEVMSRRHQFSCWRLLPRMSYQGDAWEIAREEAWAAVTGASADPTRGATHYHATYVRPPWSRVLPRLARIGRHIFYT